VIPFSLEIVASSFVYEIVKIKLFYLLFYMGVTVSPSLKENGKVVPVL
jgi:hypothetical protein